MEITDVKIFIREDGRMKAYAAVTFDASFLVHNIRVTEGAKGLVVSMPCKKRKDGKYQDVAHPVTTELRRRLDKAVIEKYKQVVADKAPSPAPVQEPPAAEIAAPSGASAPEPEEQQ